MQVFGHQLRCHQHALVHDWLLLSLSNFTQRTPFSLALWSQTVFFVSASTTSWLRASYPFINLCERGDSTYNIVGSP